MSGGRKFSGEFICMKSIFWLVVSVIEHLCSPTTAQHRQKYNLPFLLQQFNC